MSVPSKLLAALLAAAPALASLSAQDEASPTFRGALARAQAAYDQGRLDVADSLATRALERDRKAPEAWALRAGVKGALGDVDLQVHALHSELRLLVAQGAPKDVVAARRGALEALDPLAPELAALATRYVADFTKLAKDYESDGRPHGAIRVLKQVLALDPENEAAAAAIERIASAPDPSLAADAKPADLFADVTEEWIAEHDAEHGEWSDAARIERENYYTVTNAGYEVLVRTAEAMEQMSSFYKRFFRYGTEEDGGTVPRITVHVFKSRDEYLEKGIGPPVEWSGGHFTGSHVECYIGDGGFQGMVGTLFHEAAHQYVSLATSAVGWLNEGLASFFEGTRILPNGTVVMNLPADHRLFPLAKRLREGWMANAQDGYDPNDTSSMPTKAPTWRIIVENSYSWGPAWYAPTWGVVYFCYNFQDPRDGRFVYRDAFWEFVNKSGGRAGPGAVENFEEVVLGNPSAPYPGQSKERTDGFVLPTTAEELDEVWKAWLLELADERSGQLERVRPYKEWATLALGAKDYDAALEHFEKGLLQDPRDVDLLLGFADLLADRLDDDDRASKLVMQALQQLEAADEPDARAIADAEKLLAKLDPKRRSASKLLDRLRLDASSLVTRYRAQGREAMVQDLAWRLGSRLDIPELLTEYAAAVRARGEELAIWELAYDERSLDGWLPGSDAFEASGVNLVAKSGDYDPGAFNYQTLVLDRVTAGDFSLEAEVSARREGASFAGFVFGSKGSGRFHGALFLPARAAKEGAARNAWVDLMSSFGGNDTKAWRHLPVDDGEGEGTGTGAWNKLRVDVVGRHADLWWNGELLTTHEFADRELLMGNLGLVMGNGEARFRNVRFLARDPRDPAAGILRELRLEELEAQGEPVGGSYLGLVPPTPNVARWLDGTTGAEASFDGWSSAGTVPQLLVLWSIDQNKMVPIDEWLRWLAERWSNVGLRIVSVCSPNDASQIEAYLKEHPLPGIVGVDSRPLGTAGIGETFEAMFVRRFNLPRLLLLDVDGRVAWEGDPGFAIGETYTDPYDSYLKAPLEELVAKRKLRALSVWRNRWARLHPEAAPAGDLAKLLPALREAREFEDSLDPIARSATASLDLLEAAAADLVATGALLEQRGLLPAFDLLVGEWLPVLGVEVPRSSRKEVGKLQKDRTVKHWARVVKAAAKAAREDDALAAARALLEGVDGLEGELVATLRADLEGALADSDADRAAGLIAGVEAAPRRVLAELYLGVR